jgi:hypothetical protein
MSVDPDASCEKWGCGTPEQDVTPLTLALALVREPASAVDIASASAGQPLIGS